MFFVGSLVGLTSHTTPLPAGEGLGEGPPPHGLETCAKRLSELCALCERKNSPASLKMFFLSQKNTDEQNTQGFTETLNQPITQNITANRGLTPSPSPNGEGSNHRDTPTCLVYV